MTEMQAPAQQIPPHWHGVLCRETRDLIATRMRAVLDGTYFTLVTCNSYNEDSTRFSSVDVIPSQWLTGPIAEHDEAGIGWCTPSYSMGVFTEAWTRAEGLGGRPHNYVYFAFEPERVVIDHYAPAGYFLRWIFAVERHDAKEI